MPNELFETPRSWRYSHDLKSKERHSFNSLGFGKLFNPKCDNKPSFEKADNGRFDWYQKVDMPKDQLGRLLLFRRKAEEMI